MSGLLPLLIALTIIETAFRAGVAGASWTAALPVLGWIAWGLVLWLLLCETVARLIAYPDHRGRLRVERWDVLAQGLVMALFAALCYGLRWPERCGLLSASLAPWIAAMCIHWWCLAPALGRAGMARWTRGGLMSHHLRTGLVPLVAGLPILDGCAWFARVSGLERWLFSHWGQAVNVVGGGLLAMFMIGLLPWFLVRLWGAVPLRDAHLEAELNGLCRDAGVGVRALLRWPMGGERSYNAAVLGVLPRLRYVLFTDDLLRDFPPALRRAVLGHELGHARHQHLWVYLLFALVTGLLSWHVRAPLDDLIDHLPGITAIAADLRRGVVAVVVLGVQWRLLFGVLSRACERQADLAGAAIAGQGSLAEGCRAMAAALESVAQLSGSDPRAPSWRHHSIHQRMAYLDSVAGDARLADRHHRWLGVAVRGLAVLAGILLALAAADIW